LTARREPRTLPGGSRAGAAARSARIRRWELLAIALGGSAILAAFLTLPLLRSPSIGRLPRVGDVADRDYKAPVDLTVVDEDATQELRRKAGEQAAVVYDFNERRAELAAERLTRAFAAAADAARSRPAPPASGPAPVEVFLVALGEEVPLSAEAVEPLLSKAPSDSDPRQVLRLLAPVASRMIVSDAADFQRRVEKREVRVRELGSRNEYALDNRGAVLGLKEAQALVDAGADAVLAREPPARREALRALAGALVRPSLDFNLRATEEARQAAVDGVKPVAIALRQGEIIARDGDRITERHALLLRGIHEQERSTRRWEVIAGVFLLLVLVLQLVWRFGAASFWRFPRRVRDAAFLVSVLVISAAGTGIAMFLADSLAHSPYMAPVVEQWPGVLHFGIPIAAATMLVRLVHNAETALLFAVASSLVAALQVRSELGYAFFALAGSLTAALGAARVSQRGTLLRAGLRVAVANVAAITALHLLQGELEPLALGVGLGLGLFSGAVSGVLVSGVAPVVESLFAYTTDIRLLELANRENRLLRELELSAPGTYHHSMMVGHLAERAAEAIGANALEVKVAAYYHDIGKMRRPQFFVENVAIHRGENRHEKLAPSMSARIIQAHVRDGAEMGERHHLADPILRGIRQHHGTSIIRFFYEKAKELADPEKGEVVHEHDYRYPGPKPQTREAGILMLADSVEAASRTLSDNSPARVQQLVQRIINNYFRDGQLDECSLTLRDLHAIARTFIETLSAIRHERIDYPEPTDSEGRRQDETVDEGVAERAEPRGRDRPEWAQTPRDNDLRRLGLP
jgi:putative nucleotidyltransferase with HDIG domain